MFSLLCRLALSRIDYDSERVVLLRVSPFRLVNPHDHYTEQIKHMSHLNEINQNKKARARGLRG